MKPKLVLAAVAALLLPVAANAQDGERNEKASVVVDELLACRNIAADAERLACFDRTATALTTAKEKREIVVVDREGMRRAKRGLFGFSLPKLKLFGGDDDADEPEVTQIDGTVTSVQTASRGGLLLVRLSDGSTWQTTETRTNFSLKDGDDVTIKAGILGSYSIRRGSGRSVKVKRVQ